MQIPIELKNKKPKKPKVKLPYKIYAVRNDAGKFLVRVGIHKQHVNWGDRPRFWDKHRVAKAMYTRAGKFYPDARLITYSLVED